MKHILFSVLAFFLLIGYTQMDTMASPLESTTKDAKISQKIRRERNRPLAPFVQSLVPSGLKRARPNGVNGNNNVSPLATTEVKETWVSLFDGTTLTDWTVPVYGGDGMVEVDEGNIVIGRGELMTGIRYDKEFPKIDYEIRYEAKRTQGYDFFAACTFPVKESFCTLVNGGWGGGWTGLSSINGCDASENSTGTYCEYKSNTWYRFRIRVTDERIQVWLTPQDKEGNWGTEKSIIELEIGDSSLSIRLEMDRYKPLGFCTWGTAGQLRNVEYRRMGK
jgi:hypothetical protein